MEQDRQSKAITGRPEAEIDRSRELNRQARTGLAVSGRVVTLLVAVLAAIVTVWPLSRLGGELMPPMNAGDLLYMPSALPGLSAGKATQLLQQTDALIKTVPEVQTMFEKARRAESATDPAPLEMFETTIQFKPREQ